MIKKMKFAFAPFLLLLTLGACSDNEEAAPKEVAEPETAEEASSESATEDSSLELPAQEDVVVVVDGEEISGNVYNSVARQLETTLAAQGHSTSDETAKMVKEQALSVLVGNKVILNDAEEKGYEADEKTVKERLEDLKGQFESEEAMDEALKQTGFTLEDMEGQLREQLVYEQYVAEEIKTAEVTDEEVQEAYDGFVETSEEEVPALEEMEPNIRQSLEQQKTQDAVFTRIEELKKSAEVEVKI
ncbi:SurA N-terminal domain-containing protein [Planococcus sp. ISL-110]|uniref:SurA N-terminal domain-containing protein n=1 Tax=Planococcus sp. ISL-110 TaxID=2819167 RepID=UPI001BE914A8|nr:SurA N-terminal domain-containing protein [Planococcus sp. ISL-110]MBT2571394.1 SurA N-terminal domain-containing protein [Planococcus sp. ISL-110]